MVRLFSRRYTRAVKRKRRYLGEILISIDELLSNTAADSSQPDYLYESITEYDVDRPKDYDINLGGAHEVFLSGCEGEKIRIRLTSNILPSLEQDFKVKQLELWDVAEPVEIDCNLDMDIRCHSLNGEISVNQISASSRIGVPKETDFAAVCKGISTRIFYERDGKQAESFSNPEAEQVIELNGIKSELVICLLEQGRQFGCCSLRDQ